jgi:hypothetical protein
MCLPLFIVDTATTACNPKLPHPRRNQITPDKEYRTEANEIYEMPLKIPNISLLSL